MKRVLAISAHPDDEVLGCGATLLQHSEAGDQLYWLILTRACPPRWSDEVSAIKEAEVDAVSTRLGMVDHSWCNLPPTELADLPENRVIAEVRAAIEQWTPDLVYVVHPGDVHTDHRVVFNALDKVLKAFYQEARFGVQRVLSYETLSSTGTGFSAPTPFMPSVYHTITEATLESKIELMRLYESELQDDPLPRGPSAIRALARLRGATIGVQYAEAFQLWREIR